MYLYFMLGLILNLFLVTSVGWVRDVRHPAVLLTGVWVLVYGLLSLHLVEYIPGSLSANLILYAGILITIFGTILGGFQSTGIPLPESLNVGRITVLGTLGLAAALWYQQITWGLVTLITDPGAVRSTDDGGTGLLGILIYLPNLALILLIIEAARRRINKEPRLPKRTLLLAMGIMAYLLIQPERTTILVTLVWGFLGAWMVNPAARSFTPPVLLRYVGRFALFGAFALTVFGVISARTNKIAYVSNISYALNNEKIPNQVIDPYLYLTGSVPALVQKIDDELATGRIIRLSPERTALFPRRMLQVLGFGSDEILTANADFSNIPFPFNTYTIANDPLYDYGPNGMLIYLFFAGMISGFVFWNGRLAPSTWRAYYYGWAATTCVFSIFTNKFSGIFFWFGVLAPLLLMLPQLRLGKIRVPLQNVLRKRV